MSPETKLYIKARDKALKKNQGLVKVGTSVGFDYLNELEKDIYTSGFLDGWREGVEYWQRASLHRKG